jgi:mercuric ion binding protein
MKTIFTILLVAITTMSMAQKTEKYQTVEIKTSALCGDCKERIENKLNYTKGVKYAELDIDSKVVTVKFKTKKISAQEVKEAIASVGYHADDVERDSAAFKELPGCCSDPNATCTKK